MAFNKNSHDIGFNLTTAGSVGLMLAKNKNGAPLYSVDEDQFIVDQFQTASPDYGALNPQKEIALIQDSWNGGLGFEFYDKKRPAKFWQCLSMDSRKAERLTLGLAKTTITNPTLMTITNGGMETWVNATTLGTWTKVGGTTAQEATIVKAGTYSCKVTGSTQIYQAAATWVNSWRGKKVMASVHVCIPSVASGTARIGIKDVAAGAVTWGDTFSTGDNVWHRIYVSKTLDASADQFHIYIDQVDAVGDKISYWDDCHIMEYGSTVDWAEFNDDLYYACGNVLLRVEGSDGSINWVQNFPATITDLCVRTVGTSYLFIALGASSAYWYMTASAATPPVEVFTESTLTVKVAEYFAEVSALSFWIAFLPSVLYSNTSGLNAGAAWVYVGTVGASADNITDIKSYQGSLYIVKVDRPYYLDSSGVVQILTDMTSGLTRTGTPKIAVWQGKIYINYYTSLLEYDVNDGSFNWISPKVFTTNGTHISTILGLAYDDDYLYCIETYIATGNMQMLAGRHEIIDGVSQWVWHGIASASSFTAVSLFYSCIYASRLWVGSDGTTSNCYFNMSSDYLLTGSALITQWLHAEFKADFKAFIKLTLHTENCTSNIKWSVSYQILNDSTWTSIGDFTTSPSQSRYIPVDSDSNKPTSTYIRFYFTGTTNASGVTPILRSYDCRAVLYPARRKIYRMVVYASDNIVNKEGTKLEQTATSIETIIQEIANATYPVTFYDILGNTKTVKLLPTKDLYTATKSEKDGNVEGVYNLMLQEVTTS